MAQKDSNLSKFTMPGKGFIYLVEECDIFYGHIDHSTVGNFNSFDEAKMCADKHQKQAPYYYHYTIFDANGDEVYCAYPIKNGGRNKTNDNNK